MLWVLAIRSWARYESFDLPERNVEGDGLATPSFWDGRAQVGRLRSLHVAAMFATIDAVVLFVLLRHDDRRPTRTPACELADVAPSTVVDIGRGLFYAALAVIGLVVLCLLLPPMVDRVSKSRAASRDRQGAAVARAAVDRAHHGYAVVPRAAVADRRARCRATPARSPSCSPPRRPSSACCMLVVLFQRHRAKGALLGGFGTP